MDNKDNKKMNLDVSGIINGQNGLFTLILIAVIIIQVFWFIKKGGISYQGHGLRIGANSKKLLIAELELGRALVDAIPVKPDDFELLHTVELLYNQIEKWIVINNITDDSYYIHTKQLIVRAIPNIDKLLEDSDKFTEVIINELVSLKKAYKE